MLHFAAPYVFAYLVWCHKKLRKKYQNMRIVALQLDHTYQILMKRQNLCYKWITITCSLWKSQVYHHKVLQLICYAFTPHNKKAPNFTRNLIQPYPYSYTVLAQLFIPHQSLTDSCHISPYKPNYTHLSFLSSTPACYV